MMDNIQVNGVPLDAGCAPSIGPWVDCKGDGEVAAGSHGDFGLVCCFREGKYASLFCAHISHCVWLFIECLPKGLEYDGQ